MAHKKSGKKISIVTLNFIYLGIFLVFINVLFGLSLFRNANPRHAFSLNNRQQFFMSGEVRVPILVYHYVEVVKDNNDTIRKSLAIPPQIFEDQMLTLKDHGYTFITLRHLALYFDGFSQLPKKPVIITFDDGYEDFYTDVLPILERNKIRVTQFLIPGFVNMPNYLKDEQVNKIIKSGLVEIGSHTLSHLNLKLLHLDLAKREIEDSKKMIETKYHLNVTAFAYPYGGYNENLPEIIEQAGYRSAVTTEDGIVTNKNGRFTLFRIHPGVAVGGLLISKL